MKGIKTKLTFILWIIDPNFYLICVSVYDSYQTFIFIIEYLYFLKKQKQKNSVKYSINSIKHTGSFVNCSTPAFSTLEIPIISFNHAIQTLACPQCSILSRFMLFLSAFQNKQNLFPA